MKRSSWLIVFSLFLISLTIAVVYADVAGTFSYSDIPFVLAFSLYMLFVVIQKSSCRASFLMALFLLLVVGLSYIPTGPSVVTERFGEWFYLFFVFGLIQYFKET